jgi:uncharacterized Fe-S cluster-containing radical SAM superfamily protein
MGQVRCAGCGGIFPADEIGITGRCSRCWQEALKNHDLRMRTMIWQERHEIVPAGRYARALNSVVIETGEEAV